MAEVINEIIGKEAFAQIERMEKGLNGLVDTFVKSTNAAKLLETALSGTQGVKATTEQIKQLNAAQAQNEAILKKIAIAESEYGKEVAANAVRLQQLNTANKNAAREAQANEGSVNQMSASLIRLRLQYDAMSESLRKSPLGQEMVKRIQATDAALKALDGGTGRFQRNVGDYKNQLFGLTQVFRELPGFAYSAQTGILGLSNNLPILADGFKSVAAATNEATGKVNGTMGALKIFASSIFSFGNIFAIAIGLFTIFSKQIFEFFEGTKKAAEATDQLALATAKEAGQMKVLQNAIEDTNLPMEQRLDAIDELRKTFPGYFDDLSNEALLTGQVADAYDRLSLSLEKRARANIAMVQIEKTMAKIMQAEKELASQLTSVGGVSNSGLPLAPTTPGAMGVEAMQRQAREQKQKELDILKAELATYIKINIENTENFKTTDKTTKSLEKRISTSKSGRDEKTYNLKGWGDVMKNLDMFANEGNGIGAQAELIRQRLQEYIDNNPISVNIEWTKSDRFDVFLEQLKKALEEAVELTAQGTQIMSDISDAIFANEMKRITEREKRMNEYYDAETKRVNSSYTNQADRERELKILQVQKEAEQKRIDRDKITADRKRAQQQKAYDIAQITTATALAVVKAFTEGDPYTKIARAALAAAAGAAALARAISAPIPQYAKGTDNHKGGLAIVGEKGTELVTLPTGQKFLTPATDTLMDLPKGAKVLSNEKLMQSVYNLAFQKLGNGNKVSTDTMQAAMLDAFNELSSDVKELKKVMINKNTNVSINGNFDHYMHVKNNIR